MKTTNWIVNLIIILLSLAVFRLYLPLAIDRHYGLVNEDTQIEQENPTEGSFDAGRGISESVTTTGQDGDQEIPWQLLSIAYCESGNRQFTDTGEVVKGRVNPHDIGRFQINELYHGERAKALEIDLYTLEGNTQFALLLYNQQGTKPWNWSKSCWA